jgi:hypothetical protein
VSGTTYKFKVQSRNSFGLSEYSDEIELTVGYQPAQPLAPTTSIIADNVIIDWVAPSDSGSTITSYRITLQQSDAVFSQDMVNCDGTVASIVSAQQCTVPISVLTSAPYSLSFGNSIFAKVVAINYYGESLESDSGNGAIVVLVPDSPIVLADNTDVTTAYVIGFTWQDGLSSGGSPVIDYRISYDQSTGVYQYLDSGITDKNYQTQVVLTPGSTYNFKVEARNSVGYSLASAELTILCA